MNDSKMVWSDEDGDLRKKKNQKLTEEVAPEKLCLKLRRLTSGKGRTVIEITDLPLNKKWCQKLAKELKKAIGVGGTYKNNSIEIHGEKIDQVSKFLSEKSLRFKKIGG